MRTADNDVEHSRYRIGNEHCQAVTYCCHPAIATDMARQSCNQQFGPMYIITLHTYIY